MNSAEDSEESAEDPETEERNKQRVAESEAKKLASSFTMEEFE